MGPHHTERQDQAGPAPYDDEQWQARAGELTPSDARNLARFLYVDVFVRSAFERQRQPSEATAQPVPAAVTACVIVVLTVVIDLICAVLAYLLEHDAHNTQVTSFGSALFWTTTQLLTVSSSFQNPLTTGGQILDVFMEIWAMLIVASLSGSFGSFMVHRGLERKEAKKHTG